MENRKSTTRSKPAKQNESSRDNVHFLVLHNDDFHTFDYVINCLIEICGHNSVQAEQCTYLVHYKGSCDILKGGFKHLLPYYKAMAARKLIVTIE
jgi:ATP-dependent Clp protease adaptor protein ClpS